ncbi:MAG TPA: DUF6491 family protein [Xanthomonadaceae bacterium]|nr:DUF6491 family protein [Xanthomonadaceae bacterium]
MNTFRASAMVLGVLATGIALTACARGSGEYRGPEARMADRLAFYERFAGPPVDSFHFWQLLRFETLGEYTVAVWPTLDEAYLVQVRKPCQGLEFAQSIGLSSTQHRVHQRFDTVSFREQKCRIAQIRPVDGLALKRAERGE